MLFPSFYLLPHSTGYLRKPGLTLDNTTSLAVSRNEIRGTAITLDHFTCLSSSADYLMSPCPRWKSHHLIWLHIYVPEDTHFRNLKGLLSSLWSASIQFPFIVLMQCSPELTIVFLCRLEWPYCICFVGFKPCCDLSPRKILNSENVPNIQGDEYCREKEEQFSFKFSFHEGGSCFVIFDTSWVETSAVFLWRNIFTYSSGRNEDQWPQSDSKKQNSKTNSSLYWAFTASCSVSAEVLPPTVTQPALQSCLST